MGQLVSDRRNLTSLGIAALDVDAARRPRPSTGAWTMGALNPAGGTVIQ